MSRRRNADAPIMSVPTVWRVNTWLYVARLSRVRQEKTAVR